jgi:hypothetical protein
MTYQEFKKTYKEMLVRYPDIDNMYTDEDTPEKMFEILITHQKKKKDKWETDVETEGNANFKYYAAVIGAINENEQVTTSHTRYGYIPTEIVTELSDGERTIVTFALTE